MSLQHPFPLNPRPKQVSEISLGPGSGGRWATYVRVLYWGKESPAGLAAALRRYEPLPGNMGYVIDLRNNPGGWGKVCGVKRGCVQGNGMDCGPTRWAVLQSLWA